MMHGPLTNATPSPPKADVTAPEWLQAAVLVARTGTLVKGTKGNAVKNPACQMARDYAGLMTRLASRFGLTPATAPRSNTTTDPPPGTTPMTY
jgi:P27 family predicted phage terminase small subunit